MPPRDNELPEGTDHIINGAMETNGTSSSDPLQGMAAGSGGSFVGSTSNDDTGGTAGGVDMTKNMDIGDSGETGSAQTGSGDTGGEAGGVMEQLKSQAGSLRDQAGGRVREFAEGGKARATDAIEELSRVVSDAADSIDERLGSEYGEYARRASDAVAGFADTLRTRDVDELYDNVRGAVRKSPGIAIGIAAVVGFTLVRLVKSGIPGGGSGKSGGDAAGSSDDGA